MPLKNNAKSKVGAKGKSASAAKSQNKGATTRKPAARKAAKTTKVSQATPSVAPPVQELLEGRLTLHMGDCRDALAAMPDNSIDACVCDPPYALESIRRRFGGKDAKPAKSGKTGAFARASKGFMGQEWDTGEVAFDPTFWAEVFRVVKPGGYIFAFSGTRTYHHMAVAIEAAGFDCRDQYAWAYGSGFSKSHDLGKQLAKRRVEDVDAVRVVCRAIRAAMDAAGLKSRDLTAHFDGCHPRLIDHWAARDTDSQPSLPTPEQWATLKAVLPIGGDLDDEVERLNGRKGKHGDTWTGAEVIGETVGKSLGFGKHVFTGDRSIRTLEGEAAEGEGYGTAVKPAWEPIFCGRKPLIGTVAENWLAHGTGALNIKDCRIDREKTMGWGGKGAGGNTWNGDNCGLGKDGEARPVEGGFPANLLHDGSDEVLAAFPLDDQGRNPARFFYSAKAQAVDRLDFDHPTVKPIALMRWLVRHAVRRGGTVLDPFAGTGTTGAAAVYEGCKAVLVEREPRYQEMIARRAALAFAGPEEKRRALTKAAPVETSPLFSGLGV